MQYDFLSYVPPLSNISYHGNGKGPYPVHTTCATLQMNAHILLHNAQAWQDLQPMSDLAVCGLRSEYLRL